MSTTETHDGSVEPTTTSDVDHRTTHDPTEGISLSVTVVTALSEALDVEAMAVDPLYWSIDTDALDSLFVPDGTDSTELTFVHDDCSVTVRGDGAVLVSVLDD